MATEAPQSTPSPVALRVLIVDDHADSARALARLFRSEGHVVITAHTVNGAIALVTGQRPIDVLVSDIGLPDGDGCELLRRLRAFYGGRAVPAVALTGRGDEGWVEDCRRSGYGEFLMKPVTFGQVLDAVKAVRASVLRSPPAAAAAEELPPGALSSGPPAQ
jgi:CheY-like chemotaxis protein